MMLYPVNQLPVSAAPIGAVRTECWVNASRNVLHNKDNVYVEGYAAFDGVFRAHAWVSDPRGRVIELAHGEPLDAYIEVVRLRWSDFEGRALKRVGQGSPVHFGLHHLGLAFAPVPVPRIFAKNSPFGTLDFVEPAAISAAGADVLVGERFAAYGDQVTDDVLYVMSPCAAPLPAAPYNFTPDHSVWTARVLEAVRVRSSSAASPLELHVETADVEGWVHATYENDRGDEEVEVHIGADFAFDCGTPCSEVEEEMDKVVVFLCKRGDVRIFHPGPWMLALFDEEIWDELRDFNSGAEPWIG